MKKNKFLIVFVSVFLIGAFLVPMLAQAAPAQKLDFFVVDSMTEEHFNNVVITGAVMHVYDYNCTHEILNGYIGDSTITGYAESFFHVIHNLNTNKMAVVGITCFYITWKDYTGCFVGPKLMKIDLNADPSAGEYLLTGTYNFKGFGDFEGMKLTGIVYGFILLNFFEGTVLIPN